MDFSEPILLKTPKIAMKKFEKTAQDNILVNNLVPTITTLSAMCLTKIETQDTTKSLSVLY